MSATIYTAYKLKDPNVLWQFIRDVRQRAIKKAEKMLNEFAVELISLVDINSEQYKKELSLCKKFKYKEPAASAKQKIVEKMMREEYKESSVSGLRSLFDFDVRISFREYNGDIYLIPLCDMKLRNVLDFLKDDVRLEDFHYQNATDKPDDISEEDWNTRREVWYAIDNAGWDNYLMLNILTFENFYMHSPAAQRMLLK